MKIDRTKLPLVKTGPTFRIPEFHRTKLDNGTSIWSVRHRRAPVLTVRLLLQAGSAVDPFGQYGLAALTADLLDEGSTEHSGIELHEELAQIGGRLNIEVTSDATVISLTMLAKHAAQGLTLIREIVEKPQFDFEDIERVRDLKLNRLRQLRQTPAGTANRVFIESLYNSHPYGHLAIGTDETVSKLVRKEVVSFHNCWYDRKPLTVIAVGDIPEDELNSLTHDVFSDRKTTEKNSTKTLSIQEPQPISDRMIFVPRQKAVQSEIRLGHAGVARRSPDYYALRVLNMVLGGQFISRINLNLREDKGYTYGASTSFDWRVGRGPFSFQTSVQTSATIDSIKEAVREISDIRERRPVTTKEVDIAHAALTRGFPQSFETASQIANAGLQLALHGLNEDDYTNFIKSILAIKPEEVSRVASLHLKPEKLLAVVVGSAPDILSDLSSLGFGEPIEHEP